MKKGMSSDDTGFAVVRVLAVVDSLVHIDLPSNVNIIKQT